MEAGHTFRLTQADQHLWVVLSDPKIDPDHVLVVSLTTWKDGKDSACMVERGEHIWVTHRSCVAYGYGKVLGRDDFYRIKDAGLLKLQPPMSPDLLQRIREGAARSPFLKIAHLKILKQQGLVPETGPAEDEEPSGDPI